MLDLEKELEEMKLDAVREREHIDHRLTEAARERAEILERVDQVNDALRTFMSSQGQKAPPPPGPPQINLKAAGN